MHYGRLLPVLIIALVLAAGCASAPPVSNATSTVPATTGPGRPTADPTTALAGFTTDVNATLQERHLLISTVFPAVEGFNAVGIRRPGMNGMGSRQASDLPDLSGLAWLEGDRFLTVHDAKVDGESGDPRVSLIYLPAGPQGVLWYPQALTFRGQKSNDLESAALIPGTKDVLLAESGDNLEDPNFQRIFKARLEGNRVRIIDVCSWPVPVNNVEATAVAALGDRFVFLFAERAQNLPSTDLCWAVFNPETLSFGPFRSAAFSNPDPAAFNRPLVAMVLDSSGLIYISSAFDSEAAGLPDPDNGPFASAVFCIGELTEVMGEPEVVLFDTPRLEGALNGFKVESIAIRESDEYGHQIFVGTDDENYGATLRLLPPAPGM